MAKRKARLSKTKGGTGRNPRQRVSIGTAPNPGGRVGSDGIGEEGAPAANDISTNEAEVPLEIQSESAASEQASPKPPFQLKRNQKPVDFSSVPTIEVNSRAYLKKEDGATVSHDAARKAKQRDADRIAAEINRIPNDSRRVLALLSVLSRPSMLHITKALKMDPSTQMLKFMQRQLAKFFTRMQEEKSNKKG